MGTPLGPAAALLSAALLAACATAPAGPSLEVSADCQVRPASGSTAGSGPSPGGFSVGLGGSRSAPSPGNCDGPCPDSGHSGVGVGIGLDLGQLLRAARRPDAAAPLRAEGPGLPAEYRMGCLPVRGLVKGGWPMVADYTLARAATLSIEIHPESGGAPHVQRLDGSPGRHLVRFDLPASLGDAAAPALVLVRGDEAAAGLRLFGLGAGPRAVGSVAIDQVDFGPATLRRSARETARYSFFARSDFNRLAAAVLRVQAGEGAVRLNRVREFAHAGGVSRGTWFGRGAPQTWDGTDERSQASLGTHLLQLRAWASAAENGDWVTAWSEGGVQVAE
jgi:hypothetical protein